MKPMFFCVALVILAGAGQDAGKKELDKIQGEWTIHSLEVNGADVPVEKLDGTTLTVKGDSYVVKVKDRTFTCQVTLRPDRDPRELDILYLDGDKKDQTGKGIYQIDGEKLKICRGLNPDQDRPRDFATLAGTGVFCVVWKKK